MKMSLSGGLLRIKDDAAKLLPQIANVSMTGLRNRSSAMDKNVAI
jgi:hypothetical protein